MWCFSNDPNYEQKKADIVGLYLNETVYSPVGAIALLLAKKNSKKTIAMVI